MLKKYSYILFIIVFSFLFQSLNAHALRFNPPKSTTYQPVVNYTAYVVSNTDFGDTILAQATSSPNISLTFTAEFDNSGNTVSFGSVVTNASGIAQASGNYDWLNEYTNKVFVNGQTKQARIEAIDTVANLAGTARYNITIYAETIGISATVDGVTVISPDVGGTYTLPQKKTIAITCTNSINMNFDTLTNVGTKNGYTITYSYTNNSTEAKTHTITCSNIGGTATQQVRTFNDYGQMVGDITATNCSIANGASSCKSTVSWNTSYPVSTSAVTSNYPTPGNIVATGNTGSVSMDIPYSSRAFYLYNNSVKLDEATALATCIDGTSWNAYLSKCTPSPVPVLTAPNCIIATGANSCNTTLSWSVTNPTGATSVTSSYPAANTTLATTHTGSQTVTIPYSTRAFFLYNNGVLQKRADPTATCTSGTSFRNGECIPDSCPTERWNKTTDKCMTGTITPQNCSVAYNASSCNATISWSTTDPITTSQVTSSYPSAGTVVATANSGSQSVLIPLSSRTFYLYNNGAQLDVKTASAACAAGLVLAGGKCVCPTDTSWVDGSCKSVIPVLTAPSCKILGNASSCNTTLSWSITNPVGATAVTSNYPAANTTISTAQSESMSIAIPYSSRSFYLYNNSIVRAQATPTATCTTGTTWNGSICACPIGYAWSATSNSCLLMTGKINPASCIIAANASSCNVNLTWTTTNPIGTSAVTSNYPAAGTTVATGNSNTTGVSASVPYSSRSFFLYNSGILLNTMVATATCVSGSTFDTASGKCALPSGTITGNDCPIKYGNKECTTTLTWSTVNPIGVSAITSNYPVAGTTVATGNSGTKSDVVIPYSSRSFFLYNHGEERASRNVKASCDTTQRTAWDGSKCACPATAPIWDATNGYCRKECYFDQNWNPATNQCENKCAQGLVYVPATDSCENINRQPICTWKDMTFKDVSCDILSYPCSDGTRSTFNVVHQNSAQNKTIQSANSTYQSPNQFLWQDGQLRYDYVCPNNTWTATALKRPYTHFVTFEVSAGQVRKDSTINLSWNVQLPNASCKIVGTSLKDGREMFNSANYQKIRDNLTTPITSVTPGSLNYSRVGDHESLMSGYLKVSESMRFTASCVDTGYSKGYSQLVRDVYVIDEADR